jgi:hypothetical protein
MSIAQLTPAQKEALLELLILGMYTDKRLTTAEDERIQRALDQFGFSSEYDRNAFSDATFARVTRQNLSPEGVRARVEELAREFPDPRSSHQAFEILSKLLSSDGVVTGEEVAVLAAAKAALKI